MPSDLVVVVANLILWWKIDHGEQPLVHLGCAFYSVVAGFVAKFLEYFVEVLGFKTQNEKNVEAKAGVRFETLSIAIGLAEDQCHNQFLP
nr:hypothetical protein CFP56_34230 [Quercus suber]